MRNQATTAGKSRTDALRADSGSVVVPSPDQTETVSASLRQLLSAVRFAPATPEAIIETLAALPAVERVDRRGLALAGSALVRTFRLGAPRGDSADRLSVTFHSAALADALDGAVRDTLAVLSPAGAVDDVARLRTLCWRQARALERTRCAVVVSDESHSVLWVNDAFERITGFRADEVVGHFWCSLPGYSENNSEATDEISASIQALQPINRELRIFNHDGDELTVFLDMSPYRQPDGELVWISILTDVTDHRRAEHDRDEVERRALAIAASTGHWYFETDAEDRIGRVWGAPHIIPGTLIGHRREELTLDDIESQKWRNYRATIARREHFQDFVYMARTQFGDRAINVSGAPRFDADGTFLGYEGVSRDVTDADHHRINAMLVTEALNDIQELIALFDKHGVMLFMNDAFVRAFDIDTVVVRPRQTSIEEVIRAITTRWNPVADPTEIERIVDERLERFHQASGATDYEFGDRWIRIHDRPTADGGRLVVGFDSTRSRENQAAMAEALEAAESSARAADAFLARMSHELRTPLNAIIGLSELMTTDRLRLPVERLREYAGDINRSGHHLLELIQDILEFSSIRSRDRTLAQEPVDLSYVSGEAVAIIRPILSRRRQTLNISSTLTPDGRVSGDARALKQILINLLSNAAKYGRDGGRVTLAMDEWDGQVTVSIADDGSGIAARDLPHVFDPFYRGMSPMRAASDSDVDGTGLGLAIVKTLVDRMGGDVEIESEAGRGTEVRIVLPTVDADPVTPDRPATPSPGRN